MTTDGPKSTRRPKATSTPRTRRKATPKSKTLHTPVVEVLDAQTGADDVGLLDDESPLPPIAPAEAHPLDGEGEGDGADGGPLGAELDGELDASAEGDGDDDDDDQLPEIPSSSGKSNEELPPLPQTPATLAIARMSERSLSRIVGMNAYQKGRGYARRGHVHEATMEGWLASGRVHGRATEPYQVRVEVSETGSFSSNCTCPAWRGPERHCKHVAALLVALRDRMRPMREAAMAAAQQAQQAAREEEQRRRHQPRGQSHGGNRRSRHEVEPSAREVVVVDRSGPRVVSAHGPSHATAHPVTVVSANEPRVGWQIWLPPSDPKKAPDFEYRLQVRPMAVAITPYNAETRAPMAPETALDALGPFVSAHRPILRALARSARGSRPTAVELRGEDAAEVLSLLKGRRVLIEPTLMELRFVDDPLVPRMELEHAGSNSIRVKVVFERKSDGRRFTGAQGLWFEGSPAWHVDTVQGVARTVSDSVTPAWLERLSRAPAITYPIEELGRLLSDVVPRAALSLGTDLPDLSSVVEFVDANPTFVLRAEGDVTMVRAMLRASYGEAELDVPPTELPPPLAILPGQGAGDDGLVRPRVIRRDIGAERGAADLLFELGLGLPEAHAMWFEAHGDKAVAFWTEGLGSLPDTWDRFIPDDLVDLHVRETPVTPQARVSSGVDWLSLDVEFSSEGSKVNEDDLRRAILEGRRLVRLEDGSYAPVSKERVEEVLQQMAELFAQGRQNLPLSQAGRIQDLLRLVPGARVEPSAKDLLAAMQDRGRVALVPAPASLQASFRPYQREGYSWLVFLHKSKTGGVLADDMGLGKTLQTLGLLAYLRDEALGLAPVSEGAEAAEAAAPKKVARKAKKADDAPEAEAAPKKPARKTKKADDSTAREASTAVQADAAAKKPRSLVVAPTSVLSNWLKEIEKFSPSLRAVLWAGPDREKRTHEVDSADVVVTSYALLRRDEEFLQQYEFTYVILDEAQNIKNPLSATARAAKKIRAQHRLCLSGTPIENRLSEIWSIFDFLSPGLLGDLATFEERYARPIDRGDAEAVRRLREVIRPLVLRRTKREVARDLPERIVMERDCELPASQKALYQQVLTQVRQSLMGEIERVGINKSQIQILAGLTRLRQAACDPRLLKLPNASFGDDDSGKLQVLRETLAEATAGGHRTLVFSQFTEMLALIRRVLDAEKVKYEYLDGSTRDRQERVERFNSDESVSVFLISLKAGGAGLNLTGADTVIHFDPWWNPAVEDQATDRAHRIGQTRVVTAYRLIARGTIEEKIMALSAKKRELVSSVLGGDEGSVPKGLSKTDVELLLADDEATA